MELIIRDRIIYKDILDILYDIQRENPYGKLSFFTPSGTGIKVICPVHSDGHEHRGSCFINVSNENVDVGTFHCFSCGAAGSFAKFVGECFNHSERWGEEWLLSRYVEDIEAEVKPHFELINLEKPQENILDESILDTFEDFHPYMKQRHLTDEVIKKFQIKYNPEEKCIIFPVRNRQGKLVALTRRSVEDKKFIIDKGFDKKNVYLLNEFKDSRRVYVCESQINALTLCGWGYDAVALFGAGTTDAQLKELSNTGIREFVLCYDNDQAGKKGEARFIRGINKNKFISVINLPVGRDVNDLTKEEFEILNENREIKR